MACKGVKLYVYVLYYIYRWIKFPTLQNVETKKCAINARSNLVVFHEPLPWYKFFIDHLLSLLKMNFHLRAHLFESIRGWNEFKSTDYFGHKVNTRTHVHIHSTAVPRIYKGTLRWWWRWWWWWTKSRCDLNSLRIE